MKARLSLAASILSFLCLAPALATPSELPAARVLPKVTLASVAPGPRELEDTTAKSVVTDYAQAWQAMAESLAEGRSDLLDAYFVGDARDALAAGVADEQRQNMRTRYVDHGHKLDVLFYSPEGLSILVRDTAHLEIQVLADGKLVAAKPVTLHYLALLTPTEVRWKVRAIEAVPEQQ